MCTETNRPRVNMLIKVVGFDLRLRPRLSKCYGNEKNKDVLYESEGTLVRMFISIYHRVGEVNPELN